MVTVGEIFQNSKPDDAKKNNSVYNNRDRHGDKL